MKSVLDAWRANVVLDLDFRTGSLRDLSGKDNHPDTVTGVHWTQARGSRALMFPTGNDVTVPDDPTLRLSTLTIFVAAIIQSVGVAAGDRMVRKWYGAGTNNYDFSLIGLGTIRFGGSDLGGCVSLGDRSLAVTCVSGEKPAFYKNGNPAGLGHLAISFAAGVGGELIVGNYVAGSSYPFRNPMHRLVILDTALPGADILRLYQEVVG